MGDPQAEANENASIFPLFNASSSSTTAVVSTSNVPQWLSNPSFTADLTIINARISSLPVEEVQEEDEEQEEPPKYQEQQQLPRSKDFELLEDEDEDEKFYGEKHRNSSKRKNLKRKKLRDKETGIGELHSRKSILTKDYYFDSHPDPDNLAYGTLYRMNVPRHKLYDPEKLSGLVEGFYSWNQTSSSLDSKIKSGDRYWSAKNAALEWHKNFKRIRLVAPKGSADVVPEEFVPLSEAQALTVDADGSSDSHEMVLEESWEDELLRKTRDFNRLTRENPHDEKTWLAFAEFQDKVASMQPQKGARLQTLEKKISILEKATELNPDNEDLLLCLMKAYQRRDSTDILIGRWEKVLTQHSWSFKLWREFLHVFQGEFSKFKVSEMRKMYAHAIRALSAACNKQFRQFQPEDKPPDQYMVTLELGLVDIFTSLCRFEWQAGYQELATALFQAEIEYSLFSPSLLLTEHSKQRLFEYFWNSNGARVGEEGALGWSTWLEKEEETRQKLAKEETLDQNEKGGWTGWSEPSAKIKEPEINEKNAVVTDALVEETEEENESEGKKQEDDVEALLKQLGIDVNASASGDVKDCSTWVRWSEEESSRDSEQWLPIRTNSDGAAHADPNKNEETDEHFSRVVVYEDVCEYLFSLRSEDARLYLVSEFVDFYGGKMSSRISTNSSSWIEKTVTFEKFPDYILQDIRRLHDDSKADSNLGLILDGFSATSSTDMMKFIRNATLLCLSVFPRNHTLQEATLIAEEHYVTKTCLSGCKVTACQPLAKRLLKNDRQDILLCGVYAQREAVHRNMDHARRVFDMALLSAAGLPSDIKSNSPLLYLWYAEAELANDCGNISKSSSRAIHILSCLGSGSTYAPFKSHPSSLQLLRAHQGFKEIINAVRTKWVHGVIDDQSVALICSASLFEELTTGWDVGIQVLDQAFTMVLPERRSHSHQLEFLFNFYIRMFLRHQKQSNSSRIWESITQGLQIYPFSPELFITVLQVSNLYPTNKLRLMFDDNCRKKPSVIVWIFALIFEMNRGGSQHRIHGLFERALGNTMLHNSVILWRWYIEYEINIAHNPSAAKRIFFRAIHACPWSKKLWLDGFQKLNNILTAKELSDLQEVMRDKELNLRTDIYEILLQDELET